MVVKIDKGVPIPERRNRGARKYPWTEMEVGDSFLIDPKAKNAPASQAGKNYAPRKFIQRRTEEGIRVWRVE